jgi:hypothetical protein
VAELKEGGDGDGDGGAGGAGERSGWIRELERDDNPISYSSQVV